MAPVLSELGSGDGTGGGCGGAGSMRGRARSPSGSTLPRVVRRQRQRRQSDAERAQDLGSRRQC
eukprot:7737660-Pyramimonas_sp.AAC.1